MIIAGGRRKALNLLSIKTEILLAIIFTALAYDFASISSFPESSIKYTKFWKRVMLPYNIKK